MNDTERERELWRGTPSQVENLPRFLALGATLLALTAAVGIFGEEVGAPAARALWIGLAIAWAVGVAIGIVAVVRTRSARYRVTTERLQIITGIFSTREEDIELRRVRDLSLQRPFLLRLFGRGHVVVTSADETAPRVVLRAIGDPQAVRDQIRNAVDQQLRARGVRMVEYD